MGHFKSLPRKFFALLIVTCSLLGAVDAMAACVGTWVFPIPISSVPASTLTTTLHVDAPLNGSYDCPPSGPGGVFPASMNTRTDSFTFDFSSGDGQSQHWLMLANGVCTGPAGTFAACSITGSQPNLIAHIATAFTYALPGNYHAIVLVNVSGHFDQGGSSVGWHAADGVAIDLTVPFVGPFTPVPVPEPEIYALILAGLGLLGFVVMRRQVALKGGAH